MVSAHAGAARLIEHGFRGTDLDSPGDNCHCHKVDILAVLRAAA
jgi:hypothetical protein